jgi:hypothetical protein
VHQKAVIKVAYSVDILSTLMETIEANA